MSRLLPDGPEVAVYWVVWINELNPSKLAKYISETRRGPCCKTCGGEYEKRADRAEDHDPPAKAS